MVPGVARGPRRHHVKIASNTQTEAEQVLNNRPTSSTGATRSRRRSLPQVTAKASDRYKQQNTISTFYFFLNTQAKPFNNELAREAVNYALDRRALDAPQRRQLQADVLVPARGPGRPPDRRRARTATPTARRTWPRPSSWSSSPGMAGQPVTVWSETRSPRKEFVAYYTDVLNQIGFKAKSKIIADAQYFPTIGNLKTNPQTGFADWNQDFPNPSDFYLLLDANIDPADQQPELQPGQRPAHPERAEGAQPGARRTSSTAVADRWQQLDEYVAKKAYIAVYGQRAGSRSSSRTGSTSAPPSSTPLYGNDWSTSSSTQVGSARRD